jgi:integrase
MSEQLTDKAIRELPVPAKGNKVYYDSGARGLGVRVTSGGARVFVFNYRTKNGATERRYTIGEAGRWVDHKWAPGAWTVNAARGEAQKLRRRIDAGEDPMGDLHVERAAPTVNVLADRFEAEHLPKKRASTQDEYKRLLRIHIRPALGSKRVADLDHGDIEAMHRKVSASGPYAANRAVAVISKMLALAIKWKMRGDNPAKGIERAPERKRDRYLTGAEITRLSELLAAHPERTSANAARLLLLTGARKGETLAACWADFDLEQGLWVKPAATTKTKNLHRVPLSAPALALLTEMKAESDKENGRRAKAGLAPIPYLFPSTGGKPLGDIKHFWASVCSKAKISDARVHDLRHTYASILASSGLSLPIIGALLGHTQAATTARYAHLLDDPLRAATERAGSVITGGSKPSAEVVPTAGRRA